MRGTIEKDEVAFISWGRETGESGTPHLQGHLELTQRKRLGQVKVLLGVPRLHLEVRRGSYEQAQQYVEKEGDFLVLGEKVSSGRGKRNDLAALHDALQHGASMKKIADEHFGSFLRYDRGIKRYKQLHAKARNPAIPPSVVVYWGRTGTGKSRAVWDNAPSPEDVWVYPGHGWFDGYDDHQIALFDDFRGSSLSVSKLLQVLDRYPLQVAQKGSHANWAPKEIYITSNVEPRMWYPNVSEECRNALVRRFTNVVHFE